MAHTAELEAEMENEIAAARAESIVNGGDEELMKPDDLTGLTKVQQLRATELEAKQQLLEATQKQLEAQRKEHETQQRH